jgi:hypothetical protein
MSAVAGLLLAALIGSAIVLAQTPAPQVRTVDPDSVKAGDVVTLQGENLGQEYVSGIILTDGNADFKAPITEQAAAAIKIRVPASLKPGRFAVVLRLKKDPTRELEQPVKVTIEE